MLMCTGTMYGKLMGGSCYKYKLQVFAGKPIDLLHTLIMLMLAEIYMAEAHCHIW